MLFYKDRNRMSAGEQNRRTARDRVNTEAADRGALRMHTVA